MSLRAFLKKIVVVLGSTNPSRHKIPKLNELIVGIAIDSLLAIRLFSGLALPLSNAFAGQIIGCAPLGLTNTVS